jgi:hypothetical protein
MALDTQLSNAACEAQAAALASLLDGGALKIYSGTKPASADTAVSDQTLLAQLTFSATAEASVTGGLITFAAITSDSSANATGTATWFRAETSGGAAVLDGTVGTSDANMIIASTSISSGQTVSCSSFTHDVRNATSGY